MTGRPTGFEFEDHIADVRVRAWGSSLEETLSAACSGVWQCVTGGDPLPLTRSWQVAASGIDIEEALVNFLNEQFFLFDSEGLVPASVRGINVQEDHGIISVSASFQGCLAAEMGRGPNKHLKAATYHWLVVTPELIEITLDV